MSPSETTSFQSVFSGRSWQQRVSQRFLKSDQETGGASVVVLDEVDIELPDILTKLQNRTQLTRKSISRILVESAN